MKDAENGAELTVDLEAQEITRPDGSKISFEVEDFRRHCLLNGLDDISLTLENEGEIAAYEHTHTKDRPWLFAANS